MGLFACQANARCMTLSLMGCCARLHDLWRTLRAATRGQHGPGQGEQVLSCSPLSPLPMPPDSPTAALSLAAAALAPVAAIA